VVRRDRAVRLAALYGGVYFGLISVMVVRNDRTLLPVLPVACLLAAVGLAPWIDALHQRRHGWVFAGALVATLVAYPLYKTVDTTRTLTQEDGFVGASRWVATQLPPGSKIAVESYGAYIDPAQHEVHGFGRMIDHPPAWYREQGFAYLVFGSGMYARYVNAPSQYPEEAAAYEAFFATFPLVERFAAAGQETRIYAVPP
jgi:hypothetical protein